MEILDDSLKLGDLEHLLKASNNVSAKPEAPLFTLEVIELDKLNQQALQGRELLIHLGLTQ